MFYLKLKLNGSLTETIESAYKKQISLKIYLKVFILQWVKY